MLNGEVAGSINALRWDQLKLKRLHSQGFLNLYFGDFSNPNPSSEMILIMLLFSKGHYFGEKFYSRLMKPES